ncbi:GRP2 [Candida margitis]|uniref:GRP2 n=1 Tax=Candida margitis TaxID=1775924 RepID=UPI002227E769|nr:GRP2 [Candida margitis]KAI5968025.1 GRP2 [Candida margitis]
MSSQNVVFISGATGFIAQHIVKFLIEAGYKTIGSVRSEEKGEHLKSLLKSAGLKSELFNYVVVKDIGAKGAFDEALKAHPDVTVFLHTASPFTFEVHNVENDLLKPAIEGTINALNAIKEYGKNVQRVVVTSSYAAVAGFADLATPGKEANEDSWNPITYEQALQNPFVGYIGSKKIAEKTVWKFVEENKPKWEISIINPVYVFGPQAFEVKDKSKLNTSNEVINSILTAGKNKEEPQQYVAYFIDVRDVAKAHIVAFEKKEAAGQRLLLSEAPFTTAEILDVIEKDFPKLKPELPTLDKSKAPKFEDSESIINNEKTRKILGFKFIDLKKSVDDTIAQLQ